MEVELSGGLPRDPHVRRRLEGADRSDRLLSGDRRGLALQVEVDHRVAAGGRRPEHLGHPVRGGDLLVDVGRYPLARRRDDEGGVLLSLRGRRIVVLQELEIRALIGVSRQELGGGGQHAQIM